MPTFKMALGVLLLTTLGLASWSIAAPPDENPPRGLSRAEFIQLRATLDIKNQPWTTISWKYTITEARKLAAATKKPIFMVVNTGNALGCT